MNPIPCPAGLSYFPYQIDGIRFALQRPGTLLADEMGVGKGIQAIGVINALDPNSGPVLIVCPATMRLVWKRELEKWRVSPKTIRVIDGVGQKLGEAQITIINYDRLAQYPEALTAIYWGLAILDECHYIKTPEAKRTTVVMNIRAARRLALSGTPLQNRPAELRTILTWLDPGRWPRKEWHAFALAYCGAFWDGWKWNISGARNLAELSQTLRKSVMLRRTKAEVLPQLPSKLRSIVELSAEANLEELVARELYAFERWLDVQSGAPFSTGGSFNTDVKGLKVHSTREEAAQNLALLRHQVALAKVPLVSAFAKELFGGGVGKLVVFAHHRDVITSLAAELEQFGPVSSTGDTSPLERQRAIDSFQSNPATRVFLGNLKAAGTGITWPRLVVIACLPSSPGCLPKWSSVRTGFTGSVPRTMY